MKIPVNHHRCTAADPDSSADESSGPERRHLCHVLASGVFPTVTVIDAHAYGSAAALSKKQLWELFSLDR